jgi:hypothetical protein
MNKRFIKLVEENYNISETNVKLCIFKIRKIEILMELDTDKALRFI